MTTFEYPDPQDPMLLALREASRLDIKAQMGGQRAKIVTGYVHRLFEHDGNNAPTSFDALTILDEVKQGQSFRCVEYSILGAGLLWAYDVQARVVGLKTGDVETRKYGAGHVVTEYWDDESLKWVMCDVQWGVIPKLGETSLSALEFGEAVKQEHAITFELVEGSRFKTDQTQRYIDWVKEYLYFYDTDIEVLHVSQYDDLRPIQKLMLVPPNVKPPEMFQGAFKMNLIYTTDPAEFYTPYEA